MMKKILLSFVLLVSCAMLGACGANKEDETNAIIPIETTKEPIEVTPFVESVVTTKEESREGKARSNLTGEWMDEELATLRPYALMINNIQAANPQSGTSQASILYEALAEGGITRLMGIFEDFDAKRIGSVRSARHYFVSFADEYDAIFVHYGQTKYATAKIKELGVDNLSGLESIGETVFFRDSKIKAPHNAFASYKGILSGTSKLGYRTTLRDHVNTFDFYEEETKPKGDNASKVILGFSSYTSPYFKYNKSKALYYRYQFGGKHIDKATGKQLAFKNLIIQLVDESNIDKNGYQTMDIENATGDGYYVTDGKATKITWKKNESTKERRYYDKNGDTLKLNVGKTYIAVYPKNRVNELKFE